MKLGNGGERRERTLWLLPRGETHSLRLFLHANQLSLRFAVQTTVVRLGSVAELATGKQCD